MRRVSFYFLRLREGKLIHDGNHWSKSFLFAQFSPPPCVEDRPRETCVRVLVWWYDIPSVCRYTFPVAPTRVVSRSPPEWTLGRSYWSVHLLVWKSTKVWDLKFDGVGCGTRCLYSVGWLGTSSTSKLLFYLRQQNLNPTKVTSPFNHNTWR